jgi:transcription termination/antitermination protein NusA
MAVHARGEFALALNQICEERNISVESVIETIKMAVLAAYRKEMIAEGHPVEIDKFMGEVHAETGETRIFEKKDDGEKGKDVTPPGFGRIAAQTAKQVILQKIREAEKASIISDYSTKIGGLVNGLVVRFDRSNVVVDIGKSEAIMPPQDQVFAEHYKVNQRMVFYLAGIKETPKGNVIVVSRVDKGLIEGLFRREIPEVQNQTVTIKDIVREPGVRTKVAVWTDKSGVDPIGACVGQKGVRVQAVLKELGTSERIDLVLYSEDLTEYLRSALAPAKGLNIKLDEANKVVKVSAPEDQLSLAIGSRGQNVGLAARLIGWKIDIESSEEVKPEVVEEVILEEKVEKAASVSPMADSGEPKKVKKEKVVKEKVVKTKKIKAGKTIKVKKEEKNEDK